MDDRHVRALLRGYLRRDFRGWIGPFEADGILRFDLAVSDDLTITADVDPSRAYGCSLGMRLVEGEFSCELRGLTGMYDVDSTLFIRSGHAWMELDTGCGALEGIMGGVLGEELGEPLSTGGGRVPVWCGQEPLGPENMRTVSGSEADLGSMSRIARLIHMNAFNIVETAGGIANEGSDRHRDERGPCFTPYEGLDICVSKLYGTESSADILMSASYEDGRSPVSFSITGIPMPAEDAMVLASPNGTFAMGLCGVPAAAGWTDRTSRYLDGADVVDRTHLARGRADKLSYLLDPERLGGRIRRSESGRWVP